MNLFTKQKQTHRHKKQIYGYQRGKGVGRGINEEFGINRYILLYIKQIISNVLLYSTGNYIQYLIITYNGKESEKKKRLALFISAKLNPAQQRMYSANGCHINGWMDKNLHTMLIKQILNTFYVPGILLVLRVQQSPDSQGSCL